jgi:integrase
VDLAGGAGEKQARSPVAAGAGNGALLRELREVNRGRFLFPWRNVAHADHPWNDGSLNHATRPVFPDWRPQDLRRTWKTLAASVGIDRMILDRIQNHAFQDVASRHYDKYQYQKEKLAALETWERELMARLVALRGQSGQCFQCADR